MLDQSFSYDNFRVILDLENRKGIHVEDRLSMTSIRLINEKIRDCNEQIRLKRKVGDEVAVKSLFEIKKQLREDKETELKKELDLISQKISAKSFQITLKQVKIPGGKDIYTTPNNSEHFFALKQIQRNISRLFGVKQANRHTIIEQVITLLGDQFPKYVIRTDIKEFYESIEHGVLNQRIIKDNLLSPLSRKILQSILKSYKVKSGSSKGIPRGIGVSAYLAELYMRDVDNDVRDIKGVTYYSRYVDDIIIIFTPSPNEGFRDYLNEIRNLIENKHKVRLNTAKTQTIDLRVTGNSHSINYLGYGITFGAGHVKTRLTDSKVKKYKERLKIAFDDYLNYSKVNEKVARNVLVRRIRFLTGNTRLVNNKKNILVGVYYSNRHLTDCSQLDGVDKYLIWQINHRISSSYLKDRLKKYKFINGFRNKRFSPFTSVELTEIMKIWKKPY